LVPNGPHLVGIAGVRRASLALVLPSSSRRGLGPALWNPSSGVPLLLWFVRPLGMRCSQISFLMPLSELNSSQSLSCIIAE
jgi:hypothetical protein